MLKFKAKIVSSSCKIQSFLKILLLVTRILQGSAKFININNIRLKINF